MYIDLMVVISIQSHVTKCISVSTMPETTSFICVLLLSREEITRVKVT